MLFEPNVPMEIQWKQNRSDGPVREPLDHSGPSLSRACRRSEKTAPSSTRATTSPRSRFPLDALHGSLGGGHAAGATANIRGLGPRSSPLSCGDIRKTPSSPQHRVGSKLEGGAGAPLPPLPIRVIAGRDWPPWPTKPVPRVMSCGWCNVNLRARRCLKTGARPNSVQYSLDHFPLHVGKPEIPARIAVSKLLVI